MKSESQNKPASQDDQHRHQKPHGDEQQSNDVGSSSAAQTNSSLGEERKGKVASSKDVDTNESHPASDKLNQSSCKSINLILTCVKVNIIAQRIVALPPWKSWTSSRTRLQVQSQRGRAQERRLCLRRSTCLLACLREQVSASISSVASKTRSGVGTEGLLSPSSSSHSSTICPQLPSLPN